MRPTVAGVFLRVPQNGFYPAVLLMARMAASALAGRAVNGDAEPGRPEPEVDELAGG